MPTSNDDHRESLPDAPPPAEPDPRIASALEWCRAQGLGNVTLAVPFPLDADELARIIAEPEVVSLIVDPPLARHDQAGAFDHQQHTWHLPAVLGDNLVYIGNGHDITAQMLLAVIQRSRAIGFVFLAFDQWHRRSLPRLIASKARSRLEGLIARLIASVLVPRLHVIGAGIMVKLYNFTGLRRLTRSGWWMRQRLSSSGFDLFAIIDPLRPYRQLIDEGKSAATRALAVPGRVVIACPTLVAGGAERQIVATAVGLRRRGLTDIAVLVCHLTKPAGNDFFLGDLERESVRVLELAQAAAALAAQGQSVATERIDRKLDALYRQSDLPPGLREDVQAHFAVFERLRPSVVHAWLDYSNIAAGLAALAAGVPRVLLSGRNVSPRHFPYIFQAFMQPAYMAMAERSEVILLNNSQAGAADYAAWLGLPPARFAVVYNGVDEKVLVRPPAAAVARFRDAHGIPAGAPLIGGMFRLSPEKRPRLWLRTVARVLRQRPGSFALLFGRGVMEQRMRADIERLEVGPRLRILPPTADHALALSAFDILLMTSLWEGTPNVALEAQSVGTPVLLTGGGGAREAVAEGQTGLFVEVAKPRVLANAVMKLLDDPQQLAIMSRNGPAWVQQRFGHARMIDETLSLYGLLNGQPVPDCQAQ